MKDNSTVSCYESHAKAYDLYQSAVVPGYQEMLDLVTGACRRYLPEEAKIIDLGCKVADLAGSDWDDGIEGIDGGEGYDAMVSTLVLEHLPFHRYKSAIAKCCRLLKPGGWFLATEGFAEEGSDMQEWFFQEMEERRKAVDPKLSDFVARLRDERETHYYCRKAEKEEWWRQAGFEQVNMLWQYLCIALMAGRKPLHGKIYK